MQDCQKIKLYGSLTTKDLFIYLFIYLFSLNFYFFNKSVYLPLKNFFIVIQLQLYAFSPHPSTPP